MKNSTIFELEIVSYSINDKISNNSNLHSIVLKLLSGSKFEFNQLTAMILKKGMGLNE